MKLTVLTLLLLLTSAMAHDRDYLELLQDVDLRLMLDDLSKSNPNNAVNLPQISRMTRSALIEAILQMETRTEPVHKAPGGSHVVKVLMCTG